MDQILGQGAAARPKIARLLLQGLGRDGVGWSSEVVIEMCGGFLSSLD